MANRIQKHTREELFLDKMSFNEDSEILVNALELIEELVHADKQDLEVARLYKLLSEAHEKINTLKFSVNLLSGTTDYKRYSVKA